VILLSLRDVVLTGQQDKLGGNRPRHGLLKLLIVTVRHPQDILQGFHDSQQRGLQGGWDSAHGASPSPRGRRTPIFVFGNALTGMATATATAGGAAGMVRRHGGWTLWLGVSLDRFAAVDVDGRGCDRDGPIFILLFCSGGSGQANGIKHASCMQMEHLNRIELLLADAE